MNGIPEQLTLDDAQSASPIISTEQEEWQPIPGYGNKYEVSNYDPPPKDNLMPLQAVEQARRQQACRKTDHRHQCNTGL